MFGRGRVRVPALSQTLAGLPWQLAMREGRPDGARSSMRANNVGKLGPQVSMREALECGGQGSERCRGKGYGGHAEE